MLELQINKCILIEKSFIKCMKRTDNDYDQCKHIHKLIDLCYISKTKLTNQNTKPSNVFSYNH